MRRNAMQTMIRRSLAVGLAVMIGVTFMPMFGGSGYAAETDAANQDEIIVEDIEGEVDLGEVGLSGEDVDAIVKDVADAEKPSGDALDPLQIDPDNVVNPKSAGKLLPEMEAAEEVQAKGAASDSAGGITLTPDYSTGALSVVCTVKNDTFTTLSVLNSSGSIIASTSISGNKYSTVLDMTQVPIGYYFIVAQTKGKRTYSDVALSIVYDAPDNKASQYETYSNYLFFKTSQTSYRTGELYMDLRKKGTKNWTTYGPLSSENTIKKLTPNKSYQVRTFYGKFITLDDKTYFLKGTDNNKFKTITIKTGKKKLPIKSVSVKAVNVKKYTHKRRGEYTGVYLGKETWYTYRLQVTVKMKKKPGVKGLYISGKKVKGNKKTYRVKFAKVNSMFYGKHKVKRYKQWWKQDDYYNIPRGKKMKVYVYSYSNNTYKAYSPMQKRKAKVK